MSTLLIASVTGTPDDAAARDLTRLLDSLVGLDAVLLLAVRGADRCPVPVPPGLSVVPVPVPAVTSLSAGRNRALAHARATGLLAAAAVVAFPDDDCSYAAGTLALAETALASGQVDVLCGRYGPAPEQLDRSRFPDQPRSSLPVGFLLRSVSSVTMFWRREALEQVGDFDERLGVGAVFGSSEDTDLLLRARAAGLRLAYDPRLLVFHDYKAGRPSAYFHGNVAVLAKHAAHRPVGLLLARRLLGGLAMVGLGRLAAGEWLRSLATARAVASAQPLL